MKYISVVAYGLLVTSYIPMTQAHEGSSTLASALIKDQSAGQSTKQTSAIKYAHGNVVKEGEVYRPAWQRNQSTIEQVLSYTYDCAPNLTLRFQSLTEQNIKDSCALLLDTQARFQQLFNRQGKPVAHDGDPIQNAQLVLKDLTNREHLVRHESTKLADAILGVYHGRRRMVKAPNRIT